jgi:hypothetical protein
MRAARTSYEVDVLGIGGRPLPGRSPLVGAMIALAAVIAGCGGGAATPAQSLLSDPGQIVTRSLARLEASTSLHLDGTIGGSVDAGTLSSLAGGGSLGLSGKIKLDGSSFSGDVDMANGALRVSASLPSLFGAAAEIIYVDGYVYTKVTTPVSPADEKYSKSKVATELLIPSAAPEASFRFVDALRLMESALGPVASTAILLGQGTVDGRAAYHLLATVPADVVSQALSLAGGTSATGLSLEVSPVDYWVYVDGLAPAGLDMRVTSPTSGSLTVAVTMTGYDRNVTISAPPDSQVGGG